MNAGTDEAGRGPLAGPVTAAAVVLTDEQSKTLLKNGLRDSKKLSPVKREQLFDLFHKIGVVWRARSASHKRIDQMNILQASLWAMGKSVEALPIAIQSVIVDGNKAIPNLTIDQHPVIRADDKFASVMAASIVAKVLRDRIMARLDILFPQYGFAHNKGYPTPEHRIALSKFGPCPVHRISFHLKELCPKKGDISI